MSKDNRRPFFGISVALGVAFLCVFAGSIYVPSAPAVPSYSRQTGFPCRSCHVTPPELTPLGRAFKLNGYTITGMPVTKAEKTSREAGLTLLQTLPLSVFFDTSYTQTNKVQPTTQNGSFEFPQDVSLFVAGAWSAHVGSFVQFTYSTQADHFSWDQTDIRYANSRKLAGKSLVYGVTLNNTPGVEDLWHTTPAWGYPFIADDQAPTPAASTVVDGTLAQDVAGLGAYGLWNDHLYFASTMYRSEHIGHSQPNSGSDAGGAAFNIHGLAPYWRVAWQQTWTNSYLEVGSYGMFLKSTPNSVVGPPAATTGTLKDDYTDVAADFQYDRTIPKYHNDIVSLRGIFIHENSALHASASQTLGLAGLVPHHLNTLKANVEYHFGDRYTGTFGWFNTTGTRDTTLFAPGAINGSANGSPRNSGYIFNLSWWPTQNIDLAAQYTGYFTFNGRSLNYDGSGRNASDNNTTYILARFVF
ncbi:MAG TPA: hypothetical protein VJO53_11640 [Candidatus Acidoferrales bacterium]|nr:hypothetical protein [Candidatus Acidoferrales bacterium]